MSETLVTAHQPALTTRRRTPRPECLTCAHICAEAPSRTGPARIEPSHGQLCCIVSFEDRHAWGVSDVLQ
eukprot:844856-Pelagomonas_calceolata.AAC.1